MGLSESIIQLNVISEWISIGSPSRNIIGSTLMSLLRNANSSAQIGVDIHSDVTSAKRLVNNEFACFGLAD